MAWVLTKDGVKKGKLKCKLCGEILEGAEGIEDAEYHVLEWHPEIAWEGENPRDYIEFIPEEEDNSKGDEHGKQR